MPTDTLTAPAPRRWSARNVTAVLGPTNTGKTHLAIERMLGHESGLIGLPLRLLAREVYARVAARAGENQVALVTGEEKIVPPQPRYWVSTVEAMPRETDAAFVAIDEVQLAGDLERGHVFTDRLLNLRGSQETLLLGAATMRGIIEELLPGVHIVTRPRMSLLTYSGQKKLTRLPERSAVVTFSADEVYAVAELIRRQRGGAAVVLGALSPRTRNKQVELFQSGDVGFLVATDAIGMGLNLDLDHVAFAANRKYDGYQHRPLTAAELAQVAGRAGRHMRDGTFGVTGRVDPFPDALVEAIESHRFEPVRTLQWRSDALDFSSIAALKASLDVTAPTRGLTRAPAAVDQVALETVVRDPEVADLVAGPADVQRLWDVCRLPDYRRIAPAQHAELVADIFRFIAGGGTMPEDWIASQVRQATSTEGDIDTLSARIAQIRTWTFVANQPEWLADPAVWREETKAVEDALSDALHERLTQRFVDRRTSVLMRRLRENTMLEAEIAPSGDVLVEGQHVGVLQGFRFTPDVRAEGADAKALKTTAQKVLIQAIAERAERFAKAGDQEIVLSADAYLRWQGEPVARLVAGDEAMKPRFLLLADEELAGPPRDLAEARVTAWLSAQTARHLKPLVDLGGDESLAGMARGIAFRLVENLGLIDRRDVAEEIRGLDQDARASLRRHGVRFGAHHIYIPALLKPGPSGFLAQLWALKHRTPEVEGLAEVQSISAAGRTSVSVDPAVDPEIYRRFGFRIYGPRAVRIDILERLADLIRPALAWRPGGASERPAGAMADGRGFVVTPAMTSLLGASGEDIAMILRGLGYRSEMRPRPPEPSVPVDPIVEPVPSTVADTAQETASAAALDPTSEAIQEVPAPSAEGGGVPGAPGEPPDAPREEPREDPHPQTPPAEDPQPVEPPVQEPPAEEPPAEEPPQREPPAEDPPVEEPPIEEPPAEDPPFEKPPVEEPNPAPGVTMQASEDGTPPSAQSPDGVEQPGAEAEPEMVEVWRPAPAGGRRNDNRRPRRRTAQAGSGDGQTAPETREERQDRPARQGRPRRERKDGEGRRKGPQRRNNDEGTQPRRYEQPPRPPRERPADPDSPFAALAALKRDMEKTKSE